MSMLRLGAALLILVGGCILINPEYYAADQSTRDFFGLSTSAQRQKFRQLDMEQQYRLLLFGNATIHPPAEYLATEFARQGSVVVPFLKSKLQSEKREASIRDIVLVLSELDELKLYSVSKDAALMALAERRVNDMQGIWKGATLDMLARIRSVH